MVRPVKQWEEILKGLSAEQAADRILGDVIGYRHKNNHRERDAEEIGNALRAYANLDSKSE